ncbi:MAG: hypothetical protein QS748_11625 [Candidatus Endonucleobacter bathymodioli]|uniref:Uncharacterized protein n=1 Tax=Candidatus Endonucleibacter bathymodioli TaxID=539814 RepID=A0AA90NN04_9GAMM|nr:hypothetical protein [Candidatus Endonucleobacter bathymodioli]
MKTKLYLNKLWNNIISLKNAPQAIFSFFFYRKVTNHATKHIKIPDSNVNMHEKNSPLNLRSHKKNNSISAHLSASANKNASHLPAPEYDDICCVPSKHVITMDCLNDLLPYLSTTPINTDILTQYCEALLPDPTNKTMINDCSRALLQVLEEKASLNSNQLNLKSHNLYLAQRDTMEILGNIIDEMINIPEMSATVERMDAILLTVKNQAKLCELELVKEHTFDIIIKEKSAQDEENNFKKSENLIKSVESTKKVERGFYIDLERDSITYNLLDKDGSTHSSVQKEDYTDITATDKNSRTKHYTKLNTERLDQIKKFSETYPEDQSEFLYRFLVSMTTQGAYAPSAVLLYEEIQEHQFSVVNNNNLYVFQPDQKNRKCNIEIKQLNNNNIRISVSALFQIKATDTDGSNNSIAQIKSVNTEMVCEYDCSSKRMINEDRIKLQHIKIQDT